MQCTWIRDHGQYINQRYIFEKLKKTSHKLWKIAGSFNWTWLGLEKQINKPHKSLSRWVNQQPTIGLQSVAIFIQG